PALFVRHDGSAEFRRTPVAPRRNAIFRDSPQTTDPTYTFELRAKCWNGANTGRVGRIELNGQKEERSEAPGSRKLEAGPRHHGPGRENTAGQLRSAGDLRSYRVHLHLRQILTADRATTKGRA